MNDISSQMDPMRGDWRKSLRIVMTEGLSHSDQNKWFPLGPYPCMQTSGSPEIITVRAEKSDIDSFKREVNQIEGNCFIVLNDELVAAPTPYSHYFNTFRDHGFVIKRREEENFLQPNYYLTRAGIPALVGLEFAETEGVHHLYLRQSMKTVVSVSNGVGAIGQEPLELNIHDLTDLEAFCRTKSKKDELRNEAINVIKNTVERRSSAYYYVRKDAVIVKENYTFGVQTPIFNAEHDLVFLKAAPNGGLVDYFLLNGGKELEQHELRRWVATKMKLIRFENRIR